ncbi:hypothetical protein PVAR5_0978 [Paecilomyces variotii No. 5]|uniref:Uncharacterized protein n=1 Tax=Byssochlamys spectabilis (strain No. 5 / NBRC 109023) TaxID=1356009 RepID=V5FUX1_BYSSN|nr:hypothetical protein PVAR5_0978 [Paecilomyces variotii No. 5]
MPIFTIPQTLATVIPPLLPTTSSETTSTSEQTISWYTTTFLATFPTTTSVTTQTNSTVVSSNATSTAHSSTSSTLSVTPTESQASGKKTSKEPKAIIAIVATLGAVLCILLIAIWWFRKKRKDFCKNRDQGHLPGSNRPQTRSAGLRIPTGYPRNPNGEHGTPTSLLNRIFPRVMSSNNRDLGCPCPQPPDGNARYGPNSSPMNEQFPLNEIHRPVTPPNRQHRGPSTPHNETGRAAEVSQAEYQRASNNNEDEIDSIIDLYSQIPDYHERPAYESPTRQGIHTPPQTYASPGPSTPVREMVQRPNSQPLFLKLHGPTTPEWQGMSPRTPATPSTGLRTEDCDTPLFPRRSSLRADDHPKHEQDARNNSEEGDKDSPRYWSDQSTDSEYESRKRELQRRFGFGEQVFPLRLRNRSSPAYDGRSGDVSAMHGWGTFANNDPRWEEHTEHATSGVTSGKRSVSQPIYTHRDGHHDPGNADENQESRSHSISSLYPRPLVIRKANSQPLLDSLLSELESANAAARNRASQPPDEQLEYLPATRYDPNEERLRYDVRGSYASDDTIRQIEETIEQFSNMGRMSQGDTEETSSYYEHESFEPHGDIPPAGYLMPYRHTGPGESSRRVDPSPNSSRLSQVNFGSVSGSLRMSAGRSSTVAPFSRQRSEETLISDDLFGPKVRAMRAGREYVLAATGGNRASREGADDSRDNTRASRKDTKGKKPERKRYDS